MRYLRKPSRLLCLPQSGAATYLLHRFAVPSSYVEPVNLWVPAWLGRLIDLLGAASRRASGARGLWSARRRRRWMSLV